MMRRLLPVLFVAEVIGAFGWTLLFLYQKSQAEPVVYRTVQPTEREIVKKTVATGAIVPRREVAIKPQVSGVLEKLQVEAGQQVKTGDLIAEIKIIPNVVNVNAAEARLATAQISKKNAEREHQRLSNLLAEQLISRAEYNRSELELELAQQEVSAAQSNLQLVKKGAIRGSGKVSNEVRSTVDGMVIEVPVKQGVTVTESNTFSEGTTIASVADMSDLIFQGKVDESEVGKLSEGMTMKIVVGAMQDRTFSGVLEYISPKGIDTNGTIEFEVRARVQLPEGLLVRANYSATGDIILERRDKALSISERLLRFEGEQPYVEIETAPGQYERRNVELGLSDGMYAEVKSGVTASDSVRDPEPVAKGK